MQPGVFTKIYPIEWIMDVYEGNIAFVRNLLKCVYL